MKIIIIEREVYTVTDIQYYKIREMHNLYDEVDDLKISDFLNKNKENYKRLGFVDYDFRL